MARYAVSAWPLLALLAASLTVPTSAQGAQGGFPSLLPTFNALGAPSLFQSTIFERLPLLGINDLISIAPTRRNASTPSNPFDLLFAPAGLGALPFLPPGFPGGPLPGPGGPGAQAPRGILKDIVAGNSPSGGTATTRASNPAAAGVVSASLFLASSICLTTSGGLGTAYAAMGEGLALVGGLGARVNLGFEWAKAGLDLRERFAGAQADLTSSLLDLGTGSPGFAERALELNDLLTSGATMQQLLGLQGKIKSAINALQLARGAIGSN